MAISRPGSGGGGYGPGPRLGAVKKAPKAKTTSSNKKVVPKSYETSNPKIAKSASKAAGKPKSSSKTYGAAAVPVAIGGGKRKTYGPSANKSVQAAAKKRMGR